MNTRKHKNKINVTKKCRPNQKELKFLGENVTAKNIELNINEEFSPSHSSHNFFGINFNSRKLTKKELKMLRNRISAQTSRDRKKKEMDNLNKTEPEQHNNGREGKATK